MRVFFCGMLMYYFVPLPTTHCPASKYRFTAIGMISLGVAKLLTAVWLTITSALGVLGPIVFLRSTKGTNKLHSTGGYERGFFLSLANCFSGSMLLATSVLHLLPHSYTSASPLTNVQVSYWILAGILFPTLIGKSISGDSHGHSHGTLESSISSTFILLFVLMSFHGLMEGFLLGSELRVEALLQIAIPFCVHRFFDGVIIGTSLAKEEERKSEVGALPDERESTPSRKRFFNRCRVSKLSFISSAVWLAITPFTIILISIISTPVEQKSNGTVVEKHNDFVDHSLFISITHAVGTGSFIFVALSLLIEEDCKGFAATLSILLGAVVTAVLFFLFSSSV
ncbi:hypothetical protein AGDE_09237 [Angomonas deanei]|uniref:ZIP Zinc transporter, putative n=1 Tax=Angomonas deanei TaxID=59799 RepID=A0A7G2CI14_9TRYP|nr:hypothetical protein AGDE_09237 [Angomonas deanei]CAD2217862.1 ZIP Zinc transporter, putative [Angomonas deanei]|eukprot:EPY31072.1 hypothetical protein AGDE_09237 [Angomonas deanei]